MKKALSFLIVGIFVSLLIPYQVNALGFKISPIRFEINADPGQTITKTLKVENKGIGGLAEFLVQDFLGRNESGSPVFIEESGEGDISRFALSSWISFPNSVTFGAGETHNVEFEIMIPNDAEPGGHYATLFIQQKSADVQGSAVSTVARMGALIFVRVSGTTKEEADMVNFIVPQDLMSDEEVVFVTTLNNIGNIHLTPTGKLFIKDSDGNFIKGIGAAPVLNKFGGVEKVIKVDYLRFNDKKRLIILPEQQRSIHTEWKKEDLEGEFTAYIVVDVGEGPNKKIIKSEEISFSIKEELSGKIELDKNIYFNPPINFKVSLTNTGTAKLKNPDIFLEIYNILGAKIDTIDLPAGIEEIIEIEGKTDEIIRKISTGETQEINVSYDKTGFFAPYTVKLVSDGKKAQVLAQKRYWAGSLGSFGGVVAGVLVVLLILFFFIRSYLKLRKQLKIQEKGEDKSKVEIDD